MPQRRRVGLSFLLLAGSLAPFCLSSAQVPETLIGEGHLRAFLDETHYTPGAAGVPGDGGQVDRQAFESKDCRVVMDRPALGYQGDATAAPRMRQASASASFVVHGPGCVGEGGAGETLSEGVELRVLVDGSEEAATSEAAVDVTLPDLSSGNHLLAALVVAQDARGERILASSASEVAILRDIEILFPSNDFVFASGQKIVLAIGVSPTALDHFCAPPSHNLPHCAALEPLETAVGVRIQLNGITVSEFDMKESDGDDGRRVYHVDVVDLSEGEYVLEVLLTGAQPVPPAAGRRRAVGEATTTLFEIAECARNGRRCNDDGAGLDEAVVAAQAVSACPALAKAICVHSGKGEGGCSEHGECVHGVCLCRGDWIGPWCNHSLLHETEYLPADDPATWAGRCYQAHWWLDGEQALLRHISRLHSLEPTAADYGARVCSTAKTAVFATRMHGLGAQLHYLTECLTTAVHMQKAMLVGGNRSRTVDCDRGGRLGGHELARELYTCYLEPLLECPQASATGTGGGEDDGWGWGLPAQPMSNMSRYTGDQFQGTPKGSAFWWRAQVASLLLRPRPALMATLQLAKASLGYHGQVLGVHVRHGDACMHATISQFRPQCVEWEVYLERIQRMRAQYGVRKVFLATDDPEVAAVASWTPDLELMQLSLDRSMFEADWFLEFRSELGLVDSQLVMESGLLDLLLLSEASFFVGTFASHLSRLAYELMVARLGYFPPYSSVDYPWCFHMMHKDDVPGFGLVNC